VPAGWAGNSVWLSPAVGTYSEQYSSGPGAVVASNGQQAYVALCKPKNVELTLMYCTHVTPVSRYSVGTF